MTAGKEMCLAFLGLIQGGFSLFPVWQSAHHRFWSILRSPDSVREKSHVKILSLLSSGTSRLDGKEKTRKDRDFQTVPASYRMSADVFLFNTGCFHTFCWTALSRESTFICSFLRLAPSATPSEVALVLTWAISSLALRQTEGGTHGTDERGHHSRKGKLSYTAFKQKQLLKSFSRCFKI